MSAQGHRACKGCHGGHQLTAEHIAQILSAPGFRSSELCVPDGVYHERLRGCATCPRLQPDGYTCSLCGCIVQIMAKYRRRRCPLPGAARWESEGTPPCGDLSAKGHTPQGEFL